MTAYETIEDIYNAARAGDTEAWRTLSISAPKNPTARRYLFNLENDGVRPKFEPTLPDAVGLPEMLLRPFRNLVGKIVDDYITEAKV